MFYKTEEFVTHLEEYGKEWVSAVKSDTRVTYAGDRIYVAALSHRIDTVPRASTETPTTSGRRYVDSVGLGRGNS